MGRFRFLLLFALCALIILAHTTSSFASEPVVATTAVGNGPISIAVNRTTNRVYVSNNGGTVSVLDGTTQNVIATIPTGGSNLRIAVDDHTNRIYVVAIKPGNAGGFALAIDGTTNNIVATIDFGTKFATGVAINPFIGRVFVTDDQDAVFVIDEPSNAILQSVPLPGRPIGVAVNAVTNRVYIGDNTNGRVFVLDGTTYATLGTIPVGTSPGMIAVNQVTNRVYVANIGSGNVSAIDGATNTVSATVATCCEPQGVAVNEVADRFYVATATCCKVMVFNGPNNQLLDTSTFGQRLYGIDSNPCTGLLYVGDTSSNKVRVFQDVQLACPPEPTPASPPAPIGGTVELAHVADRGDDLLGWVAVLAGVAAIAAAFVVGTRTRRES